MVRWLGGADSPYALGIVLHVFAATVKVTLVLIARAAAREAIRNWHLTRARAPAHAGYPPNECADVTTFMGRAGFQLSGSTAELLQSAFPPPSLDTQPAFFSIHDALQWTELDESPDEMLQSAKSKTVQDIFVLACATANVLVFTQRKNVI